MSWFVEEQTRRITVNDPDSNEEGWVEIRELSAGDMAKVTDTVRMNSEAQAEISLGTFRMAMVELAVVNWSFEVAATPHTIRRLHPKVFEQIASQVVTDDDPLEETS